MNKPVTYSCVECKKPQDCLFFVPCASVVFEREEPMYGPGVYKHYKGGLYTLLMYASDSTNGPNEGARMAIYVSHTTGKVCVRLASEFFENIKPGQPRFQYVGSELPK